VTPQIETVNAWLKELASAAEIDSLELNEQGVCAVRFGDRAEIVFEVPDPAASLHLYCPVCEIPSDSAAETALYRRVLEWNMLGLETRGAAFAVDRESNRILLCYSMPLEGAEVTTFQNTLGNFAEVCERFCDELNDADPRPSGNVDAFSTANFVKA